MSIVTLKTENSIGPVQKEMAEAKSVVYNNRDDLKAQQTQIVALQKEMQENSATDSRSVADRIEHARLIEKNTVDLSHMLAQQAAQYAEVTQKLTEVETQFRAMESYENLTRVYNNRMIGMLWQKVYNQAVPEYSYSPTISAGDGRQ